MKKEISYHHHRANFNRALQSLESAIALPILNPRDSAGIIQNFEFVYELAWKSLKEYLAELGHVTSSAREVFKTAYRLEVISDEALWIGMIQDRNLTVHTYNENLAEQLVTNIRSSYLPLFRKLKGSLGDGV
jgi:nucleotidyltransferase substrate binding protein (TIGR01987 family)